MPHSGWVALAIAYFGWLQQKKRREAISALAGELGLQFLPQKDRSAVRQFEFLDLMRKGRNRFILNRLTGTLDDYKMEAFDFHYETHSTDSKVRLGCREFQKIL